MQQTPKKPCKFCGSYAHYSTFCRLKPKTAIQRTRLKQRGKHYYLWIETRNRWLEQNKAPYYFCYICGKMMTRSQLTLDHVKSRSRHPELRYVLSNLQPTCAACNRDKGSMDLGQFLATREQQSV